MLPEPWDNWAMKNPRKVPKKRPPYTLEQLLSQCDPRAPLSEEDRLWLNDLPFGRELS